MDIEVLGTTDLCNDWHSRSISVCRIRAKQRSVLLGRIEQVSIHIVNNGPPRRQISRHLMNQFLPMGGIGSLIRIIANQLAIAVGY